MDCRNCHDDLTAYMDGELPGAAGERMKDHLERCPPCRAEYEDLKDSTVLVESNFRDLEPAPELWNNLRARITEMPSPEGPPGFFRFLVLNRWAAAVATLAATVVLAMGLWGYLQHQQSERELQSYMNEYIEMRNITERIHSLKKVETAADTPGPSVLRAVTDENPFATAHSVSFDNPFRSEER